MEVDPLAPWLLAVKLGLYTSALMAAGLGLHVSAGIVDRGDQPRVLRSAALLGCAAVMFAALRLAIANIQLGGSLSSIVDAATLSWTWPTLAASSIALALGGALSLAAWLSRKIALAALSAIAFAAGFALTGHTQALDSPGIAPWGAGMHVLIAAFWIAAPITLWPHAPLSDETVLTRSERFSRLALLLVPGLFVIALWLALLLAGSVNALFSSLYGQLLLAKLVAAATALALGGYNKQIVARKLRAAPAEGRRALVLTLTCDALLFASALVLVGIATTFTGPPTQ